MDAVYRKRGFDSDEDRLSYLFGMYEQMTAEEKHGWKPGQEEALSHRAKAFQKFARAKLGSA